MSGEMSGWSTWSRFKKAGVVDEHVDFSDNQVVVDNVLGRTGNTIGKCWPIDAAVAYSLAKAGPDAKLTVDDMVNEYTRTATAMMSRRVGWGKPYLTGLVDGVLYTSCGEDEVRGILYHLMAPEVISVENSNYDGGRTVQDDEQYLKLTTSGWRAKTMKSWLEERRAPEDVIALSVLRMESNAFGWLVIKDIMLHDRMKPLKDFIESSTGCNRWRFTSNEKMNYDGEISASHLGLRNSIRTEPTRGECAWKDQEDRYCTWHDADRKAPEDWWLVSKDHEHEYEPLASIYDAMIIWGKQRHSQGYNENMFKMDGYRYHGRQLTRWSDVRRKFSNSIADVVVRAEIKKALNRMSKRNDNILKVVGGYMGDGKPDERMYRWDRWDWLATIQAAVAQTSKKLRKEGDVVNGWKYTKTSSKTSYGHEIATFEWQADGDVCSYTLTVKPRDEGSYYSSKNPLPFRFKTMEDALKFKKMLPMIAVKAGAVGTVRVWDKETGKDMPIDCGKITVTSNEHGRQMKMKMDNDPEDLPSPTEIMQKVFWGLPNEYEAAVKHLNGTPFIKYKMDVVIGGYSVEEEVKQ